MARSARVGHRQIQVSGPLPSHYRLLTINLNHASPSHNARLNATNSAVATPLSSILIRPRRPSNSTTAPGKLPAGGAISSTNVGGAVRRVWRGASAVAFTTRLFTGGTAASARCLSLPYSRCRAFAVGLIPARGPVLPPPPTKNPESARGGRANSATASDAVYLPHVRGNNRNLVGHRLSSLPSWAKDRH